ncbi:MAG: hypothetical protein ACLPTF_14680 [Steroidobacteraceae bacterium]
MLSIYELLILLFLPAIVLTSFEFRRLAFWVIAMGISTMSYLNSLDRSTSAIYLQYYLLVIIPHMLLFLQIFENDEATRAFFISFVKTGVWLGPLAVLQFLSPVQITLANNTNYFIVSELHRTALFAPEASILAALYVIAISLAIYNSYTRIEPRIPAGVASYVSMVAGLATTLSTSVFIVLPPLLLFTFRLCGVSWKTLIRYAALGSVVMAAFYFVAYESRVSAGDSTSSTLLRFASVLGGIYIILQHSITGLGLGMNKNVEDAVKVIYFALTHNIIKKAGIDSFQIGLMAEMGVLPGLFSIAFVVVCYKTLKKRASSIQGATALIAMLTICLSFVSLLTSGYRGLAYCWLSLPAGYVVYLRNKSKADLPVLDSAVPLVAGDG